MILLFHEDLQQPMQYREMKENTNDFLFINQIHNIKG